MAKETGSNYVGLDKLMEAQEADKAAAAAATGGFQTASNCMGQGFSRVAASYPHLLRSYG
jgi:hypothetical protein